MPYHRDLIFASELVTWQEATFQSTSHAWSDCYRPESARMLVPMNLAFECSIGAATHVCDASTALWLTPSCTYRLRHPLAGQRCAVIVLPTTHIFRRHAGWAGAPIAVQLQLRLSRSSMHAHAADALRTEEWLFSVVNALLPDDAACTAQHAAVKRAREYLAYRAQHNDSMAHIAAAACCSPYHLARIFRRATGQSLHSYRTGLRMVAALDRLQQGQQDLSALALDLGYSSHSHFCAVFARWFGKAPTQLRRSLIAAHAPQ